MKTIVGKVWPYLLVGIALGAAIHGWLPTNFFTHVAGPGNPLAVPIAVILGLPFYSNAAGTPPPDRSPAREGNGDGHCAALMMGIVALSLPDDPAAALPAAPALDLRHRDRRHRNRRHRLPVQRRHLIKETPMHTIKVLGSGCANCDRLTALTAQALDELGRTEQVEKVTDYAQMAALGVMATPALAVDDQFVLAGRIPGLASLKDTLAERLQADIDRYAARCRQHVD